MHSFTSPYAVLSPSWSLIASYSFFRIFLLQFSPTVEMSEQRREALQLVCALTNAVPEGKRNVFKAVLNTVLFSDIPRDEKRSGIIPFLDAIRNGDVVPPPGVATANPATSVVDSLIDFAADAGNDGLLRQSIDLAANGPPFVVNVQGGRPSVTVPVAVETNNDSAAGANHFLANSSDASSTTRGFLDARAAEAGPVRRAMGGRGVQAQRQARRYYAEDNNNSHRGSRSGNYSRDYSEAHMQAVADMNLSAHDSATITSRASNSTITTRASTYASSSDVSMPTSAHTLEHVQVSADDEDGAVDLVVDSEPQAEAAREDEHEGSAIGPYDGG